jgi:hypothetical protein
MYPALAPLIAAQIGVLGIPLDKTRPREVPRTIAPAPVPAARPMPPSSPPRPAAPAAVSQKRTGPPRRPATSPGRGPVVRPLPIDGERKGPEPPLREPALPFRKRKPLPIVRSNKPAKPRVDPVPEAPPPEGGLTVAEQCGPPEPRNRPLRVDITARAGDVTLGEQLQLRAEARLPGGERENVTPSVTWEVSPPTAGIMDDLGRFEAREAGAARVVAVEQGVRSAPFRLAVLATGLPDWDVTHLERIAASTAAGPVRWCAHVKNYGTAAAPAVPFECRLDGRTVGTGTLARLARFEETEVVFAAPADGKAHTIELRVNPDAAIPESCAENSVLRVSTEARPVAVWVEESILRYFHQHQKELGAGANSWEDWAQRQVTFWNERQPAASTRSAAPRPWRLDRIIVVGDGRLPLAPGGDAVQRPDPRFTSAEWVRGFPASLLAGPTFRRTTERTDDNPFFRHAALLAELPR